MIVTSRNGLLGFDDWLSNLSVISAIYDPVGVAL